MTYGAKAWSPALMGIFMNMSKTTMEIVVIMHGFVNRSVVTKTFTAYNCCLNSSLIMQPRYLLIVRFMIFATLCFSWLRFSLKEQKKCILLHKKCILLIVICLQLFGHIYNVIILLLHHFSLGLYIPASLKGVHLIHSQPNTKLEWRLLNRTTSSSRKELTWERLTRNENIESSISLGLCLISTFSCACPSVVFNCVKTLTHYNTYIPKSTTFKISIFNTFNVFCS